MALFAGVAASAISSALTGRILPRVPAGPLLAAGSALVAGALAMEALASALWLIAIGSAVFSTGFGAIDAALNAYAAGHFGAGQPPASQRARRRMTEERRARREVTGDGDEGAGQPPASQRARRRMTEERGSEATERRGKRAGEKRPEASGASRANGPGRPACSPWRSAAFRQARCS